MRTPKPIPCLFCLLSVALLSNLYSCGAQTTNTVVTISGKDTGRVFDGIGALSAGASSRLLIDYPAKQRSEILDYLFKPNYGAALQINKVEVGGDTNSTDGSEPSHMHTPTDENYRRGYEWWLMQESKKRNPKVKLYALEWGTPGWINPNANSVWTDQNQTYLLNWLRHAKSDHGLTIDYIGGWNERGHDKAWYERFRSALNSNGFADLTFVGDDSTWNIGEDADADPAFAASFEIIGVHYPGYSPKLQSDAGWQASLRTGKPLWGSEIGAQPYDTGAANLAKNYNQGYIAGKMTAFINWSTIWSVYRGLLYAKCGLMLADEPWSGHYVVGPSIWVTAQTTQFAQPGWQYLDAACGYFGGASANGSYVTLKSPNGRDYSLIAETVDAQSPQSITFTVSGGLSGGSLHMWKTDLKSHDSNDWFIRQNDIATVNGAYAMTFQPGCVYTLTTTTGQTKGQTNPPPSSMLPLPYHEDFQRYAIGATPRLVSDQQGTFEVARAGGERAGKALRQVVTQKPVLWASAAPPSTLVGDSRWQDYQVSSDVLLEQPGTVDLVGRMQDNSGFSFCSSINGYHLRISDTGQWSLLAKGGPKETALASGVGTFPVNTWHRLTLKFALDKITAMIDGKTVVDALQDETYEQGLVGYEVGSYQNAEFQNLDVTAVQTDAIPSSVIKAAATSFEPGYEPSKAVDGDSDTFWHTEFSAAKPPLPQSITIDLGAVYTLSGLRYLPRQDGSANGRIIQYVVYTSMDGTAFEKSVAGDWADDASRKSTSLPSVKARFVRLEAVAADGGYVSAAEIKCFGTK